MLRRRIHIPWWEPAVLLAALAFVEPPYTERYIHLFLSFLRYPLGGDDKRAILEISLDVSLLSRLDLTKPRKVQKFH